METRNYKGGQSTGREAEVGDRRGRGEGLSPPALHQSSEFAERAPWKGEGGKPMKPIKEKLVGRRRIPFSQGRALKPGLWVKVWVGLR